MPGKQFFDHISTCDYLLKSLLFSARHGQLPQLIASPMTFKVQPWLAFIVSKRTALSQVSSMVPYSQHGWD